MDDLKEKISADYSIYSNPASTANFCFLILPECESLVLKLVDCGENRWSPSTLQVNLDAMLASCSARYLYAIVVYFLR